MTRKSILRHNSIRQRKNFFPLLAATILSWLLTGTLVYFVDPATTLVIPVFFILVFFSLLFTFSIVFANSRRGLIVTAGLVIFLTLRFFGIGHVLNFILILALCVCLELYFNRSN